MSKLVCQSGAFSSHVSNIQNDITEFSSILSKIEELENSLSYEWKSDTQKAYYNCFISRKADLEELKATYDEMVDFLNDVVRNYQEIESNYS